MSNNVLIELKGIHKSFFTDDIETKALNEINLKIFKGDYISISGPSGCGKSTFLSILGLLDTATDGQYNLAGHDVSALNKDQRAEIRSKEIGFVFQSFNLISDMTVEENIKLPLTYRDDIKNKDMDEMVLKALSVVDIQHRRKHYPSQLSGGQQQRVAVARAIVGNPSIILADEPTGNLDSKNAQIVIELLEKLHAQGTTICMVTHNPESAARAHRQLELLDGQVASDDYRQMKQVG